MICNLFNKTLGNSLFAPFCKPKPCEKPPSLSNASFYLVDENSGYTYGNLVR